jgi:polyphosphate kinase
VSQTYKQWDLSYTQNRELSWLKFNARVLEEATDRTVPLMERFRFLSIFTSNLDEFFRVRVGSLFDLSHVTPKDLDNKSGKTPSQQLEMVYDAVRPLIRRRDAIYAEVQKELCAQRVEDIPYDQLRDQDKDYVNNWYRDKMRPLLVPQIIDRSHPFPHLKNKVLYGAALLQEGNKHLLGIVGVPESVPAILFLPDHPGGFVRTETILEAHLRKIFKIYRIEEQAVVAVTRNADISYDENFDEDGPDLRSHMAKLIKQRERLRAVRLEIQGDAPGLKRLLQQMLRLEEAQTYTCSCPLVLGYAYQLDNCGASLFYPPHEPTYPTYLDSNYPMWEQICQRDVLLFYPYHSMQPFLDLLKEAAIDPKVLSIQITIYRLARNSAVVRHLVAAAENGKEVTVMVELRARFDEQNNIEWAKELESAGCRVIYGAEGYKCHAKICLITRQERNGISRITQVGTGNYNEKTAALYTDFCMMTADPEFAMDAVAFFQNMLIGDLWGKYSKLLVAPVTLKETIMRLIDGEIMRGTHGRIIIKANSVTERDVIDKLAEASQAGVRIDLIIRGICCLVPGIPGKTENITVTSIVGRFLEHSRVYCFGEGDLQQIYISSADCMTRNLERRVEIASPVTDPELKAWFVSYLNILLHDNVKARRLLPDGDYIRIGGEGDQLISSQQYYLENPPKFSATVMPRRSLVQKLFQRFSER